MFGPDVSAKLIKSQDPFGHTKFNTTHQTVEFSPQDSGDTYVCRDHQTQLMHGERVDLIQHSPNCNNVVIEKIKKQKAKSKKQKAKSQIGIAM